MKGMILSLLALLCPIPTMGSTNHSSTGHAEMHKQAWLYASTVSNRGPSHWHLLPGNGDCATVRAQSPINIDAASPVINVMKPLELAYNPITDFEVSNNQHTAHVGFDSHSAGSFRAPDLGGKEYHPIQFHFHSPSENTINGKHYDVEMHIVHKAASGQASDFDIAVISVMFDVSPTAAHNDFLSIFWDKLQPLPMPGFDNYDNANASYAVNSVVVANSSTAIDLNNLLKRQKATSVPVPVPVPVPTPRPNSDSEDKGHEDGKGDDERRRRDGEGGGDVAARHAAEVQQSTGAESGSYYTFEGSFTTPPCTGAVKWYVMTDAKTMSATQLRRFRESMDFAGEKLHAIARGYIPPSNPVLYGNNRPVQPVNGRLVLRSPQF